jgi:hypothetical protein
MTEQTSKFISRLNKFKYPLIILAAGIVLMMLPAGKSAQGSASSAGAQSTGEEKRMEYVLSGVDGAGEVRVLLSDGGAVVVCAGADDAAVRLELTQAVKSFTGFGSDRITILKIADMNIGEAAS